ncbi:MAG: DUF1571 domain-containing protein [Planctomycetota bacterium]
MTSMIINKSGSTLAAWISRRGPRLFVGLLLMTILCVQYQLNAGPDAPVVLQESVVMAREAVNADPFEALIRHDPLAALIVARAEHLRDVIDYECVMMKQELLPAGMSKEQEIKVKFRHAPYSVYMEWQRNPGLATRAIYVKGRWTDLTATNPDDRELAVAQPGILARLFVKSLKQPIHGRLARKASRRCIDDFGFQKTLDRLITVCETGKSRGELTLDFRGESQFDDRPVWVIRRHLPYTVEGGLYPDRTVEMFIDKEYRVPVAVYCYSDVDRHPSHLIAKYEYRSIRMQAGLTEKDFDPLTYGM